MQEELEQRGKEKSVEGRGQFTQHPASACFSGCPAPHLRDAPWRQEQFKAGREARSCHSWVAACGAKLGATGSSRGVREHRRFGEGPSHTGGISQGGFPAAWELRLPEPMMDLVLCGKKATVVPFPMYRHDF
jgi:hypothetical protein